MRKKLINFLTSRFRAEFARYRALRAVIVTAFDKFMHESHLLDEPDTPAHTADPRNVKALVNPLTSRYYRGIDA